MGPLWIMGIWMHASGGSRADEQFDPGPSNATSAPQSEKVGPRPSEGRVLRHAVFFRFKASATEEEVARIENAFLALPAKIPAILAFDWGVNNSPEGLDDGFTHCFLITFRDEKGRADYLPHPAHAAFVDMVKPRVEKAFVIDYWGQAAQQQNAKSLKHAVFFQFKENATPSQIARVEQAFEELPSKIAAITDFEWGTNNSPEKLDDGFTHCFMVTFSSEDGRAEYLPHSDHRAFVELLKPTLAKARVLDFWTSKAPKGER